LLLLNSINASAEAFFTASCRSFPNVRLIFSRAENPIRCPALKARHWFLWVRCPACRTTQSVDLRTLDRHPFAALTSLVPALSCRSCRPHAPFAELICLADKSVADGLYEEHARRALGE
jgi:ribosomal protein S27E